MKDDRRPTSRPQTKGGETVLLISMRSGDARRLEKALADGLLDHLGINDIKVVGSAPKAQGDKWAPKPRLGRTTRHGDDNLPERSR
jgi:hypothetical protein